MAYAHTLASHTATLQNPLSQEQSTSFDTSVNHVCANVGMSPKLNAQTKSQLNRIFGATRFSDESETRESLARTTLPVSTKPLGVVWPEKASEVCELMPLLSERNIPWHAISRGKNWGYGDACAPADGHLIIDLRRMNRIVEINEDLGFAVIEPGVSQGQLAEELEQRGSRLMLDVTGAGPDASIVGNALQRGFGHTPYGDHFANSCNYEAILTDGKLVRTGFGDVTGTDVGHVYPYGNGPCYQGAFAQSNAGIVTRMTIWLMPRAQSVYGFGFKTNDRASLSRVVDCIRNLRLDGTINSVVHIANDVRVLSTQPVMKERSGTNNLLTSAERRTMCKRAGIASWNGLGGLYGSSRAVAAKRKDIRQSLGKICRVRFFSHRHVRLLSNISKRLPSRFEATRNLSSAITDVFSLINGHPSPNHLEGAFYRNRPASGEVIDAGLAWIAPVLPFQGKDVLRLAEVIESSANRLGFDLPMTISPVFPRSAICVSNLSFDKNRIDEAEKAKNAYRALREIVDELGYPVYRKASVRQ